MNERPQYQEFTMSIDHKFTPAYKEAKQLELIVSYEHEGDIIKPDSILVAFSPFTGMWIENMVGLMAEIPAACEAHVQDTGGDWLDGFNRMMGITDYEHEKSEQYRQNCL